MVREPICMRSSKTTRGASCRGYVTAHHEVMPHAAFDGQTPDERYFGTGGAVPAELATARQIAREERMKANRSAGCGVCVPGADSDALQLQRPQSRML